MLQPLVVSQAFSGYLPEGRLLLLVAEVELIGARPDLLVVFVLPGFLGCTQKTQSMCGRLYFLPAQSENPGSYAP